MTSGTRPAGVPSTGWLWAHGALGLNQAPICLLREDEQVVMRMVDQSGTTEMLPSN